jgi:2-polyprenyl-3-methyl-5-hydroxy-6-metoxy-1,4-benzoquinol methylase
MGEMSRHQQSKSEGCRRHDRAGHEKFMPQETASLRNTGRFAQPHPLLLRLMIREVRASVQRAPTSTLQPRGDATVDICCSTRRFRRSRTRRPRYWTSCAPTMTAPLATIPPESIYWDWIVQDDFLSPTAKPQTVEHYSYLASEVLHLLAEQRRIIGAERRIRVLDYGMGWSAWLQMARSFGAVVSGVELSDPKVEYARSIGISVLSSAEIAAMQFDIICTEQVFEHVAHPAPLLELLVSALAPTGFLKISVPEGHSAKKVLSGWKWSKAIARKNKFLPVHPLEHINCFRTDSLDRFAARFGLERARVSPLRAAALSSGWHSAISTAKNLLRPMYRFGLRRGTYAIYRRREERAE